MGYFKMKINIDINAPIPAMMKRISKDAMNECINLDIFNHILLVVIMD